MKLITGAYKKYVRIISKRLCRQFFKLNEYTADLLPKFAKVDIGIEHIELILCYTLTRIKQGDIIEVEKLLQSKLNPKKRENIMKSIAHHWMQQDREEKKAIMVKKMQEEKIAIARNLLKQV